MILQQPIPKRQDRLSIYISIYLSNYLCISLVQLPIPGRLRGPRQAKPRNYLPPLSL